MFNGIILVNITQQMQNISTVPHQKFIAAELFHILPRGRKFWCILLGFYVTDKNKVVDNCEVDGKLIIII